MKRSAFSSEPERGSRARSPRLTRAAWCWWCTATECGFTPQFVVLGFPANDFAGQEPRSDREIGEVCRAHFGVTFPMSSKLVVTGEDAHPLGEPD